ncbi:hypothetical protein, partial [Methanolobus psychrotolerans]|uniref:hypothetical protein n=1 Tax=Methanolobus psychrotolerans TaxID=1874706 RepID=UPI0013EAAA36
QTKQDAEFVMPVFKLPEQTKQETEFVMPELKLPEQTKQDAEFVMPELKLPEQTKQETEFVMPELKLPEQTKQDAEFVMPDLNVPQIPDTKSSAGIQTFNPWETKTAPELPPFKMPEMQHPGNPGSVPPFINDENCSMQGIQSTPAPTAPVIKQSTDTKPDKLEGNILMYMPRGAKVKKDIIKSLVSRQFSQEEVDRKIKELVAREVLVLKQENGIEHLHRLK